MSVHVPTRDELSSLYHQPRLLLPIVLEEANAIRACLAYAEGKLDELPQGIRKNPNECVLARALSNGWSASVDEDQAVLRTPDPDSRIDPDRLADALEAKGFDVDHAYRWLDGTVDVAINHTWAMERFVHYFDADAYPELVLGERSRARRKEAR